MKAIKRVSYKVELVQEGNRSYKIAKYLHPGNYLCLYTTSTGRLRDHSENIMGGGGDFWGGGVQILPFVRVEAPRFCQYSEGGGGCPDFDK